MLELYAENGHGVEVPAEFRIYPFLGLTIYLHGISHRVRGIFLIFALVSLYSEFPCLLLAFFFAEMQLMESLF